MRTQNRGRVVPGVETMMEQSLKQLEQRVMRADELMKTGMEMR